MICALRFDGYVLCGYHVAAGAVGLRVPTPAALLCEVWECVRAWTPRVVFREVVTPEVETIRAMWRAAFGHSPRGDKQQGDDD